MRSAPLVLLGAAIVAVIACSSKSSPPPHPAYTVDCQTPTISSGTPKDPCQGVCLESESCDGGSTACPPGFLYGGVGQCPNSAVCCMFPDAGVRDGEADSPEDSPAG